MPISDRQLAHNRPWIEAGLVKYADRAATHAALRLADELLHYKATHQFTFMLDIQAHGERLRGAGVTARDLLIRAVEFAAFLEVHPDQFRRQREEDYALARTLLRCAPIRRGGKRPGGNVLRVFGEIARLNLYPFAFALLKRLGEDAEKRDELRRACMDFEQAVEPPR